MKKLFVYLLFFLPSIDVFSQQMIPFSQFEKWGLIDAQTKKIILTPQFKEIIHISNQAILVRDDEKYFFINKEAKPINDRKFCYISYFSENMIGFLEDCEKGKYGYADSKGQILIAPQYSKITDFKEELAAVFLEKNWQYINFRGQKMIQIADSFSVAKSFSQGYAIIGKDINFTYNQQYEIGHFQVINKQGKLVLDTKKITQLYQKTIPNFNPKIKFNHIKQIKDNLLVLMSVNEDFLNEDNQDAKIEKFEALINLSNNTFIELPQEKSIEIISSKMYKIQGENMQVFALQAYSNKPFQVIQNSKGIGQFQENRLPFANQNNEWGYTDETGKEVIPAKYNFVSAYYQGKAIAQEKNQMLVMLDKNGEAINIDKKGTLTTKYWHNSLNENVEKMVFTLKFAKRFGLINQKMTDLPFGMFVYGFDSLLVSSDFPPYYVKKQKGWAMIKNNDKNILPNLYQEITPLSTDENGILTRFFSFVKLDNKYGIYHESGAITSPFLFDKIE
ncbi:MAG: WG repeat-containing protein, partial [Bacteroidetes bacterium]